MIVEKLPKASASQEVLHFCGGSFILVFDTADSPVRRDGKRRGFKERDCQTARG